MKTTWRLLSYVRPHGRALLFVVGTMLLLVALDVLRPWPTKILVDQVLGEEKGAGPLDVLPGADNVRGLLFWVCLSTVLIFVVRALVAMVSTRVSVTVGQRMVYALAADLFGHVQRLSLLFHSRRPLGDLVSRVTVDTYCLQVLIGSTLLPLVQALLTLGAMFFVMWRLEPIMTLLSLAVIPFLMLLMYWFSNPMKEWGRLRRDLEGRMMSLVEQTLSALPAVQAFTREETEHDRFQQCAAQTVAAYRRSVAVDMWFKLLVGLVTALGTAGIMWLGAGFALDGRITVGTILVFLAYLASLYEPLNSIIYTASLFQYAAANADRVLEILDTVPEVTDAADAVDVPLRGQVRFENVTFGYDRVPVLRDVSLAVEPGEVIAVVGPTGAGKTTLINLLLRLYDPWSGRLVIDGHDVRRLRVRALRRQIAIVLQEPFLLPLTVAENLAYGVPDARREDVIAAARAANADDFIRRLPDGYDSVIGEKGATLSGGEKQRLAIARALLKNAPILILDEPTSALDAHTEAALLQALQRLMAGRTTFIIAHRLSTIRHADRIVVLADGRIVETGRHDDLLNRGGLYASLVRQQTERPRPEASAEAVPVQ